MDESVEQKAEQLARMAADRAAKLALVDAEQKTALAVDRAVKDANIDRDLAEHSKHLEEINGSQRQMADSLADLLTEFQAQTIAQQATAKAIEKQQGVSLSRRTAVLAALGVIAAYGSLVLLVVFR